MSDADRARKRPLSFSLNHFGVRLTHGPGVRLSEDLRFTPKVVIDRQGLVSTDEHGRRHESKMGEMSLSLQFQTMSPDPSDRVALFRFHPVVRIADVLKDCVIDLGSFAAFRAHSLEYVTAMAFEAYVNANATVHIALDDEGEPIAKLFMDGVGLLVAKLEGFNGADRCVVIDPAAPRQGVPPADPTLN